MRGWTISRRIAAGFVAVVALLAVVVAVATIGLVTTRSAYESVADEKQERAFRLESALEEFGDAAVNFDRYLLVPEPRFLEHMTTDLADAKDDLAVALEHTENPAHRVEVQRVQDLMDQWVVLTGQAVTAHDAGNDAETTRLLVDEIFPLSEEERTLTLAVAETALADAAASGDDVSARTTRTMWFIIGFGVLAVGLAAVIGLRISRFVAGRLREAIDAIGSAAREIMVSTTQQAANSVEEQTALQQTLVTTNEMSETIRQVAERAETVSRSAERTVEVSKEGQSAVAESIAGAAEAKAQMEQLARLVLELSEKGQTIGEIVTTVTDFADQSNLLAVNASIEAAKAGDAGKGFSVVATEVKALAEGSKRETAQIREILTDVQHSTQAAVMAAEQGMKGAENGESLAARAGDAIQTLAEKLGETSEASQQIRVSSHQQSAGSEQVLAAMQSIGEVAAQSMEATAEVEQAASDLNDLADQLNDLVGRKSATNGRPLVKASD